MLSAALLLTSFRSSPVPTRPRQRVVVGVAVRVAGFSVIKDEPAG